MDAPYPGKAGIPSIYYFDVLPIKSVILDLLALKPLSKQDKFNNDLI